MQPEIEIIRTADGRHVGEAIVTFGTRNEAERAIIERNRFHKCIIVNFLAKFHYSIYCYRAKEIIYILTFILIWIIIFYNYSNIYLTGKWWAREVWNCTWLKMI